MDAQRNGHDRAVQRLDGATRPIMPRDSEETAGDHRVPPSFRRDRFTKQFYSSAAIALPVSTMRFEKPHSLSYQETTRTSLPSSRSEEHTSELQSLMRTSYAVLCFKKHNIYVI